MDGLLWCGTIERRRRRRRNAEEEEEENPLASRLHLPLAKWQKNAFIGAPSFFHRST
jgi:hypothetical protein